MHYELECVHLTSNNRNGNVRSLVKLQMVPSHPVLFAVAEGSIVDIWESIHLRAQYTVKTLTEYTSRLAAVQLNIELNIICITSPSCKKIDLLETFVLSVSVQLLWGRLTQIVQSGPHSYPRGLGITAKARHKTVVSKIWVSMLLSLPGSVCVCVCAHCAVCKIRWLRPSPRTASAAIDSNQIHTILPFFSTRETISAIVFCR